MGKLYKGIAFLAACLAAGICLLAVFLLFRVPEAPILTGDGADGPGEALAQYLAALERQDWEAAGAFAADGSVLGLDKTPEDPRAARLWRLQLETWDYSLSEGYQMRGEDLAGEVSVSGMNLSSAGDRIRQSVQRQLEQAVEAAELKSEVYDENGDYREELVYSCLDKALEEIAGEPEKYLRARTVTVNYKYVRGRWMVLPDGELAGALLGNAVFDSERGAAAEAYDLYFNNLVSSVLDGLMAVPKVYRLAESVTVAPAPDPEGYGTTRDPADTAEVIAAAEELLRGKKLIWTPETETLKGRDITWYRDETLFAVSWRQNLGGDHFTFCEVVTGHPSQMRRYLADDDFHSFRRYPPTRMAKTVNAAVALSGDFYHYRELGIVVYKRELFRADGKLLDTCFVDSGGNLLFVRAGELAGEEEIRQYIADNDVVFSLAFGPVMIEDGENVVPPGKYPIGQIQEPYSRCVLCQIEECHYLLVAVSTPVNTRSNLRKVADMLVSIGVPRAYALDGGQTASLIINGRLMNPVDFGEERTMSDIIYFASALPEREE